MLTQWDILGDSCNIIVSHCNEGNDEFSSFERFKLYDSSKAISIEDVTFSFSFLLKQKSTNDSCQDYLQNYNITVRMLNKVTFYNNRKHNFNPQIIRMITDDNMILEIEYVDYAIARNIISTIDSWEAELEKNDTNKILEKMQEYTKYLPNFVKIAFFIITTLFLIKNADQNIKDFIGLAKFGLISCFGIYIFMQIGHYLGRFIESNFDGLLSVAYIDINRGDKKEIKKYKNSNIRRIISVILLLSSTTILAFMNEQILNMLKQIIK